MLGPIDAFDIFRTIGEVALLIYGIYLTRKTKDKTASLLKEKEQLEEVNKRQRIEIVLQEEKIEEQRTDIRHLNERLESRTKSTERRNRLMNELLPNLPEETKRRLQEDGKGD